MTVTNVSGSSPWILTVTRGVNGTTAADHNAAKVVYKVVADTTVQVTNTGGTSSVKDGETIEIENERMLVTGVSNFATGIWNLTVTRAVPQYHQGGARRRQKRREGPLSNADRGHRRLGPVGHTIQIENEQMVVTNVSGSGPWTLTVTRGINSTTVAAHNPGEIVYRAVADTTIQVTNTGGSSSVQSGDTIKIDNEYMLVTGVANFATGLWNLTVIRAANGTAKAVHTDGDVVSKVTFTDRIFQVTNTGGSPAVAVGDTIQIGTEQITSRT